MADKELEAKLQILREMNDSDGETIKLPSSVTDKMIGLSLSEQLFAENYVATYDPIISLRNAGYSFDTDVMAKIYAQHLLRNEKVSDYIDALKAFSIDRTVMSYKEGLLILQDIARGTSRDALGNFEMPSPKDRVGALKELMARLPDSLTYQQQEAQLANTKVATKLNEVKVNHLENGGQSANEVQVLEQMRELLSITPENAGEMLEVMDDE